VERLAREIAGPNASAEILDLARRIAEAQIDVYRARYARHRFPITNVEPILGRNLQFLAAPSATFSDPIRRLCLQNGLSATCFVRRKDRINS
jgi:hypothetical protein